MQNWFTVDVEDYFHVSAFERHIDRSEWASRPSRVENSTGRLLDLLAERGVRGTFFVLGWVAERHPQLVRRIRAAGHEIGSHSYWHRLIYELTPDEFRADLVRSRNLLEDLTGARVAAFRAPSFSVTRESLWALEILAEEGFECDSSVYPVHHDRYGIPNARREVHRVETAAGPLVEFPPSVARLGRLNVPVSGGGYFRLYPISWTLHLLERVNRKEGRPFVFYVHPWEIDPGQPRLACGSRLARARHYVNLHSTASKLEQLLARFAFAPRDEVVLQTLATPATA